MRVIVQFSGGKDSLASLIWACNKYGPNKVEAVFCDTQWEHEITYRHINEVVDKLGVKLTILKGELGFVDLAIKKSRFPSTKARFCTQKLKTEPFIDWLLDTVKDHVIIIQGIRADESEARSKMSAQCSFFRYYYEPYGYDKKDKPKYHTYRKKEVLRWREQYSDDILRPIFDWSGPSTMQYIIEAGLQPNPLYFHDMARVGCFPCIMCRHIEIKSILEHFPEYIDRLMDAERMIQVGKSLTFFPPDYIPAKYCSVKVINSKGKTVGLPSVADVVRYVSRHDNQTELQIEDDNKDRRCMSFYGICE